MRGVSVEVKELRVFVVGTHRLFCEAVGVILQREGVHLVDTQTERQAALARIAATQPDVILVEEGEGALDLIADLTRLAQTNPGTRLISLSFENNQMSIFHRQQRTVGTTKDLIEAITGP